MDEGRRRRPDPPRSVMRRAGETTVQGGKDSDQPIPDGPVPLTTLQRWRLFECFPGVGDSTTQPFPGTAHKESYILISR